MQNPLELAKHQYSFTITKIWNISGIMGSEKLYQSCMNKNLLETHDDFVDDWCSGTINYCFIQEGHKHT